MRALDLKKQNEISYHNLGIITSVDHLSKYDMIYIYHHLQKGSQLVLKRDESNPFEPQNVEVYFRGFKLGYVSQKSCKMISRLIDKGYYIDACVKGLGKNKYMPLNTLDIEIKTKISC